MTTVSRLGTPGRSGMNPGVVTCMYSRGEATSTAKGSSWITSPVAASRNWSRIGSVSLGKGSPSLSAGLPTKLGTGSAAAGFDLEVILLGPAAGLGAASFHDRDNHLRGLVGSVLDEDIVRLPQAGNRPQANLALRALSSVLPDRVPRTTLGINSPVTILMGIRVGTCDRSPSAARRRTPRGERSWSRFPQWTTRIRR